MEWTPDQTAALIKGVYDGEITETDLPVNLYEAIAEYLKKGVYSGFGSVGEDESLLNDLVDNIYMFSAAKVFQEVRDMSNALMSNDGKFASFSDFKKEADQIFDTYNKDYLKTEYDTAIGQSQMASKWQSIESQKDVLPYLVYSTIGDACIICAPLNGFTAKVDDPIWDTIMPMNHFNCRCLVEQEEDGEDSNKDAANGAIEKMSDVFKMNPGKDRYVFKPDHPYFTVPKEFKKLAGNNFNLKIP